MPSFAERIIAAHQAGVAEKQRGEQLQKDEELRKLNMDIKSHELKALKLSEKIRQAGLNPVAPEVTAPPAPTIPSDFGGGGAGLQPDANTDTRQIPMPLPPISVGPEEGVDQPMNLPVTSLQQHLTQLAEERRRAQMEAMGMEAFKSGLRQQENQVEVPAIPDLGITTPLKMDKGAVSSLLSQAGQAATRKDTNARAANTLAEQTRHNKAMETRPTIGGALGGSQENIADTADGIIGGTLPPPDLASRPTQFSLALTGELKRKGYDLATARRDWVAISKYLSTLNGTQQLRVRQAIAFTAETLPQIEETYAQWKKVAGASGFKILNKANLAAMAQLPGEAGSIASNLQALIKDFTSELGTVYKGGNASTDESLKLAAENLKAEWNERTFTDAMARLRKSLAIRKNSLTLDPVGVSPDSPYAPPQPATETPAAQTDQYPEGTVISDGKTMKVMRGGKWVNP